MSDAPQSADNYVEVPTGPQELSRSFQEWSYYAYSAGGGTSRVGTPDGAVVIDRKPTALNAGALIVLDEAGSFPDNQKRGGIPALNIRWGIQNGQVQAATWELTTVDRQPGGPGFGDYTSNLQARPRTDISSETTPFIKRALTLTELALTLPARPTKISQQGQAPMDFFVNQVRDFGTAFAQVKQTIPL